MQKNEFSCTVFKKIEVGVVLKSVFLGQACFHSQFTMRGGRATPPYFATSSKVSKVPVAQPPPLAVAKVSPLKGLDSSGTVELIPHLIFSAKRLIRLSPSSLTFSDNAKE
jgi:hypothetical protein